MLLDEVGNANMSRMAVDLTPLQKIEISQEFVLIRFGYLAAIPQHVVSGCCC
jgi:hypothetical protein